MEHSASQVFFPVSGVFELSFAESLQPLSRIAPINKKYEYLKEVIPEHCLFIAMYNPFKI
ncbi:hypothetical protein DKP84_07915 [Acinetobacter pittii]|nr:hypothetical protein DKP84_07915 [Acinetobacter pittii]